MFPRAFPSVGPRFLTELRQCEASRGAYACSNPLLDLILGRRKLDQTTLVGAQRSCCWLFHFHRAVFWPDRTRSCPEPSNAVIPPVIPLENSTIRVCHPRLARCRARNSPNLAERVLARVCFLEIIG